MERWQDMEMAGGLRIGRRLTAGAADRALVVRVWLGRAAVVAEGFAGLVEERRAGVAGAGAFVRVGVEAGRERRRVVPAEWALRPAGLPE